MFVLAPVDDTGDGGEIPADDEGEDDGALSLDKCTASFLTDPTFS